MDTLALVINTAFNIYWYMVIAYILMSWVPQMRETSIGQLLKRMVEPLLSPFRKLIPPLGMIDISPMVALGALYFARIGVMFLLNQASQFL